MKGNFFFIILAILCYDRIPWLFQSFYHEIVLSAIINSDGKAIIMMNFIDQILSSWMNTKYYYRNVFLNHKSIAAVKSECKHKIDKKIKQANHFAADWSIIIHYYYYSKKFYLFSVFGTWCYIVLFNKHWRWHRVICIQNWHNIQAYQFRQRGEEMLSRVFIIKIWFRNQNLKIENSIKIKISN